MSIGDITDASDADSPDQCARNAEALLQSALLLHKQGWHPVALGGDSGKILLASGITGYSPSDAAPDDFRFWPALFGTRWRNLGVRCPIGVLGVDVDDGYPDRNGRLKHGLKTVAEYESRFGAELPATYLTTARPGGGGIRWYRVPDAFVGPGALRILDTRKCGDVELIQRHHRYGVVPPSIHHTGQPYRLYGPDGCVLGDGLLPPPGDLPELPAAWLDGLAALVPTGAGVGSRFNRDEIELWLDAYTGNDYPHGLRQIVKKFEAEISEGADWNRAMLRAMPWAFKEARADAYPAREADRALTEHPLTIAAIEEKPSRAVDLDRLRADAVRYAEADDHGARQNRMRRDYGTDTRVYADLVAGWKLNPESGENLARDPISVANRELWAARPELTAIHDFAKCRRIGPWGLLGVALTRALASIPPEVVLPPILGTEASLNFYLALVGVSGGSKTVAISAGESFVETTPHIDSVMPGTGEGLAKQFAYVRGAARNAPPQQVGVRSAALLTVDEIGTLTALAERSGQTIMPTLRSAWSGADLGFGNGDPTKSPRVYRHRYRLTLMMGVQPDSAGAIFAEASVGTPQRFLWMPTHDDDMLGYDAEIVSEPTPLVLEEYPERPAPASLVVSGGIDRLALLNTPVPSKSLRRLSVPEVARREVLQAHDQRARMGNWMTSDVVAQSIPSDIDGHLMLMREKVAVALMRLAGRHDGFTDEDWHLAGVVMSVSNYTRERMQYLRSQRSAQETRGKASRAADFEIAKAARIGANADEIAKIANRIVGKLETKDGQTTNKLFNALFDASSRTTDRRQLFDAALRNLVANQRAKTEDFTANNGVEATKVWLS
ncbi:bifunctional DNA primase/polymerase [Mycolicibacterium iranicum]|uniref:Bifunctional DNA primase/polymerase n=1 Tax=Mycolicibacterium iranicum TaxID=912594 RepID=A0ABT4HPS5_MYCIR|nr:bifunctional DNA primase/polymerase [Mycolicibacterium iranicum]MCZ0731861.1 bifunctional DNA primase/polymerase [Mycolicibacterium iranicum]